MFLECTATSTQLEMAHKAKAIRERLLNPPNSVQDRPLSLKKQTRGITGTEARKLAQEAAERLREQREIEWANRIKEASERQQVLIEEIIQGDKRDWLLIIGVNPRENKYPPNFINHIKQTVARRFLLTTRDLESARRSHDVVIPRHVAQYLCKCLTLKSLPEIGRHFSDAHHTSVLNACRKMPGRMLKDQWLCLAVVELQAKLEYDLQQWRSGG